MIDEAYVTECMALLREMVCGCLEDVSADDQRAFLAAALKYIEVKSEEVEDDE